MRRIRVLVAEDHYVTRMGLRAVLSAEADIEVVGEATTGTEALALYAALRPDVALVDLRLPGMPGHQVIRALRERYPDARAIVLTVHEGSEEIYRSLQAGARAYLLKDTSGEALLNAVREVHAGRRVLPAEVGERLAERVPQSDLSPREVDVLRLLVTGLSNKAIGAELGVSEGTVRTHVSNILLKLGAAGRTEAATEALRRGIV
jgi:two-component system NarL family response regulator